MVRKYAALYKNNQQLMLDRKSRAGATKSNSQDRVSLRNVATSAITSKSDSIAPGEHNEPSSNFGQLQLTVNRANCDTLEEVVLRRPGLTPRLTPVSSKGAQGRTFTIGFVAIVIFAFIFSVRETRNATNGIVSKGETYQSPTVSVAPVPITPEMQAAEDLQKAQKAHITGHAMLSNASNSLGFVRAKRQLQIALEGGVLLAAYEIGYMHENELIPNSNKSEAIRLYMLAASAGSSNAAYRLGTIFSDKAEPQYDTAQSLYYFEIASRLGHQDGERMAQQVRSLIDTQ